MRTASDGASSSNQVTGRPFSDQRMLTYHSSRVEKGFTPRLTGWFGKVVNFGVHIGLMLNWCS